MIKILITSILLVSCLGFSQNKNFKFINPDSLAKSPAYSQIGEIKPNSKMFLISGQVSQDEKGVLIGKGDIKLQTQQVYANLEKALTAIGATFKDVVAFKIYITDATKISTFREVRNVLFDTKYYKDQKERPVSTAMAVSALFNPDWLIEIEATVVLKE